MPDNSAARLTGTGLVCDRGERRVFAGLDLTVAAGEALAVVGPNGTGKSSLLRLLAGLLPPAAGTLVWNGSPVSDEPEAHRARLHYVGHLDAVKPSLTAAETLLFQAQLRGARPTRGEILEALEVFGMSGLADLPSRFLSQGQRRRAALARLAAVRAPLWLLDEPTLGLDADSVVRLAGAMARHRADGGLIIVATHGGLALGSHTTLDLGRPKFGRGGR
jgi:heme exporter protein A